MNFKVFPIDATNVFPATNSVAGGQLVTEFNLRAKDCVASDEAIKYMVAPSYVHSEADFFVKRAGQSIAFFPEASSSVSNTLLEILPGTGVINGYFVQSLVPITIDLAAASIEHQAETGKPLSGHLAVGLKIMFNSDVAAMAGSIKVENNEGIFEGVQVVVLPTSSDDPTEEIFLLPIDVPTENQQSRVTAHIKLAEFDFINGKVAGMTNNYPEKCQMFPASRIKDINSLISSDYVSKKGLQPKKLYTFAGKGTDPATGRDTWCDSTDSLMVWDTDPQLMTQAQLEQYKASLGSFTPVRSTLTGELEEAVFGVRGTGELALMVPHKQVDYNVTDQSEQPQVYAPKMYPLPAADFYSKSPGTVTSEYTEAIWDISRRFSEWTGLAVRRGKQRAYVPELDDINDLPAISTEWAVGDYVLVGRDNTVISAADMVTAPSTLYVVSPGTVTSLSVGVVEIGEPVSIPENVPEPQKYIPEGLGQMLDYLEETGTADQLQVSPDTGSPKSYNNPEVYSTLFTDSEGRYTQTGVVDLDYYVYFGKLLSEDGTTQQNFWVRYDVDTTVGTRYSEPIFLTGTIPMASSNILGGFYNVDPATALDAGYIYQDEQGYLRLVDYALLRSGALAYQLGEDFTVPSTLAANEIQEYLDEYVNNRVAFPNSAQLASSDSPYTINVTITLPDADEETTINIEHIDSRFNTHVYLHFLGTGNNVIVNIADCEKVRIDSNFPAVAAGSAGPTFNLFRSSLFYDAVVLEKLSIIEDLGLWYVRFNSTLPDLVVDDLTVRQLSGLYSYSGTVDIWDEEHLVNDNHFQFGLNSISFNGEGNIVGCTILAANSMTTNLDSGRYIFSQSFELPQTSSLMFPKSRLTKPLKVTGSFVAAYNITGTSKFVVNDTNFTLLTQSYPSGSDPTQGSIAIYVDADQVTCVTATTEVEGVKYIDGWEPGTYHLFAGGVAE